MMRWRHYVRLVFVTWLTLLLVGLWVLSTENERLAADTTNQRARHAYRTANHYLILRQAWPPPSELEKYIVSNGTRRENINRQQRKPPNFVELMNRSKFYHQFNHPNTTGEFQHLADDIIVFSAFLDDRIREQPVVRIMTIIRTGGHTSTIVLSRLQHKLWCVNPLHSMIKIEAELYEMCENHAALYGGYMLSCDWPPTPHVDTAEGQKGQKADDKAMWSRTAFANTRKILLLDSRANNIISVPLIHSTVFPTSQTITPQNKTRPLSPPLQPPKPERIGNTSGTSTLKPIRTPQPKISKPINYAVCVHTPLHGERYSPIYMIEYIEMQLALGVEHLMFYVMDDERNGLLRRVLDFYTRLGVVTQIWWPISQILVPTHVWYMGQLIIVQDCLYRSIAAGVRHLAQHDLDELIVPHAVGVTTLGQLVTRLWTKEPEACGFHVTPVLHYSDGEKADSIFNVTQAYKLDESNFMRQLTKPLIKPERVFELGIHHISKQLHEGQHSAVCPEDLALMHHYSARFTPQTLQKLTLDPDRDPILQNSQNIRHIAHLVLESLMMTDGQGVHNDV